MNLGDMILNFDMDTINDRIKNLPPEILNKVKAKSLAVGASVDLILEIIDSPTIEKMDFTPMDMAYFSLEVLSSIAAICVFRLAMRANDIETYCDHFKVQFQTVFNGLKEVVK